MKNYYEILEVSHNASQEIIEKAYKTLAKKYHPDLQEDTNKKEAEQKMKEINEAYDIISNPEKRSSYDEELQRIENEKQYKASRNYQNTNRSNDNITKNNPTTNNINQVQNNQANYIEYQQAQNDYIRQQEQIKFELEKQQAIEKAYYDAYIQDLKNRGYKIKYKKTFKEHIINIISIFIVFFVLFLILQIPFVKNYFIGIYEENEIIKRIVDLFISSLKNLNLK